MKEVFFLTLAEAMDIHTSQIQAHGGSPGVRDPGMLESALAVPRSSFEGDYLHEDIFEMAAAYAFHLCQNHPFVDGNKRVALLSASVFLEMNGIVLHDPQGHFYKVMMGVANGRVDNKKLAAEFRKMAKKRA